MTGPNTFFDDLAKMASGALGTADALRQEIEGLIKQKTDGFFQNCNLIGREEFDVVKDMVAQCRERQDALEKRLTALEGKADPSPHA